jgi:hypothetical protein
MPEGANQRAAVQTVLHKVVLGAGSHRLQGKTFAVVAGNDDHGDGEPKIQRLAHRRHALRIGEIQVQQDDIVTGSI